MISSLPYMGMTLPQLIAKKEGFEATLRDGVPGERPEYREATMHRLAGEIFLLQKMIDSQKTGLS